MPTTRRRSRLRSSQYPGDRWKPSGPVIVLALGVVVGSFLGMRGRLTDQSATRQEHYMLLASDLYAQGAPLPDIRNRLVGVGFVSPSDSVLQMANQLATSHDKVQQQEGDQLHQFAEALVSGSDSQVALTPIATAEATTVPTATASPDTPTATVAPAESTPAQAAAATPVPAAAPPPAPTATAAPPPPAQAVVSSGKGVIHTSDHKPATLRKDPTTKSVAVAALPYGSTVQILGVVQGEAAEPGEARWYHVKAGTHQGYVYVKLVQAGG